jgi:hypothetical protein
MSDKRKPEKEQDEPLSNEQKKLLEKLAEIAGRPEAPSEEKSEEQEDTDESKEE